MRYFLRRPTRFSEALVPLARGGLDSFIGLSTPQAPECEQMHAGYAACAVFPGAQMFATSSRLIVVAVLCAGTASPCHAESFASSASSAGSASSGSVSDSLGNSSKSSTRTNTADGDYRVIEVAELADRPGMLQLTLQATAPGAGHEFVLKLPRQALAPRGINAGDIVQVRNRDYGLEFARANEAQAREAFFLVLDDAWQRELEPQPVPL
jgi:hypothetical protein